MSDIVHVIKATINPNSAPTRSGQHWVNETTKQTWLSVGTSTISDWVLMGDSATVKVTGADTTADYLASKLSAGTGIVLTTLNPGGDEIIEISSPGATTDEQVKVSSADTTTGYLSAKIVVDNGTNTTSPLESSIVNPSGDEDYRIRFDQTKLSIVSAQVSNFNEAAQDAVGGILTDTASIDFTYNDAGNTISAVVLPGGVNHDALLNWDANKHIDHSTVLINAGTGLTGGGDIAASRTLSLANTAVTPGTYGSATQVGTFTVDAQGRLISAGNASIAVPSTAITDFTEAVQDVMGGALTDSLSIDFQYNDLTNTLSAVVLPSGVNHDALLNWVANKHIDHSTVSLIAGTGISSTGLGDLTASRTINLANTTVTASSYGSASQVGTFTVDAQGRLTAAANVAIAVPSTAVTDFTEAAQDAVGGILTDTASIDFTYNDAGNQITAVVVPGGVDHDLLLNFVANEHVNHASVNINAGTGLTGGGDLTASRTLSLANIGTAGTYGSATQIPVFTTNAQGQVISVTNTTINTGVTLATGQIGFGSGSNQIIGDNELFWDNTNKRIGIGTNTPESQWHIVDDTGSNMIFEQANNSLGESAFFECRKASGTIASKLAVTTDDKLGGWGGLGWTGTQYLLSTYMSFSAEGPFTNTSAPGYFSVFTTPSGSTTPVERFRINSAGDTILSQAIRIGTTTDTTNGNIRYDGTEFQVRESAAWRPVTQTPISTSATSAQNSTSSSFASLTSIATTPAAGSYRLEFTASVSINASSSVGEWAVFVGGVQQTATARRYGQGAANAVQGSISITTLVTVNGSQAVDVQFRRVSGTGTITTTERQMILTPYQR
jgi:hypothetical protein